MLYFKKQIPGKIMIKTNQNSEALSWMPQGYIQIYLTSQGAATYRTPTS